MSGIDARTNADRRGSGHLKKAIAIKGTKNTKKLEKRRKAEKPRRAEQSHTAGRPFSVLSFPQSLRCPPLMKFFHPMIEARPVHESKRGV
jgi:hypothetical protein